MTKQQRKSSARTRAGALAATGLIASSAAAAGLGTIAMTPAGAATATKFYACYSSRTHLLSDLTATVAPKCGSGTTRVTWNGAGPQGAKGAKGSQGAEGKAGAQGNQGNQGAQGGAGIQGAQGAQGFQGAQGAQGFQGAQGGAGTQGHQGFQGVQGALGTQGAQGFQGAQGSGGAQGPQGTEGSQGSTGAQGAPGAVAGYYGHGKVTLPAPIIRSSSRVDVPAVVAIIDPLSGDYAVTAAVKVHALRSAIVECYIEDTSTSASAIRTVKSSTSGDSTSLLSGGTQPIPITGFLYPRGHSTLSLICEANNASVGVTGQMTATSVNSVTGSKLGQRLASAIRNRFDKATAGRRDDHHATS